MPGPIITPAAPGSPSPAPAAPAPVLDSPVPLNDGAAVSQSVGGSVVMPNVAFKPPKVQGEDPIDRGDEAEFLVMGTRVGHFLAGSRITAKDLGEHADPTRLVELGVISELPKAEKPAKSGK